jgi:hypothetical protein
MLMWGCVLSGQQPHAEAMLLLHGTRACCCVACHAAPGLSRKQPLGCSLTGLVALYDQRFSGLQHGHAAAPQTQLYCDGT